MIDDIKELLQSFLVPRLEGIQGDIRTLDTKLDARVDVLDTKIDAVESKIENLDDKLDGKLFSIDTKLEAYRRELVAEMHRLEGKMDERLLLYRPECEN